MAWRVAQLDGREELAPGFAEQISVLVSSAVLGKDRMHPVLDRRAHRHQRDPVAKQLANITQLSGCDIRLGQQPGAQ